MYEFEKLIGRVGFGAARRGRSWKNEMHFLCTFGPRAIAPGN